MESFWALVGFGVLVFLVCGGYFGIPLFVAYLGAREGSKLQIQQLKTEEARYRLEEARVRSGEGGQKAGNAQ